MSDRDLIAIGFSQGDDGVLVAPKDSRVRFEPVGAYYKMRISLGGGNAVIAVLAKSALKITREGKL